jgi:hypothetical protein
VNPKQWVATSAGGVAVQVLSFCAPQVGLSLESNVEHDHLRRSPLVKLVDPLSGQIG